MEHILQAIDKVFEFTKDVKREDFKKDSILYFAIVKNIEIIGEASYMLSLDFKDAHPENISVVTEVLHDVLDCLPPGFCAGTYAPGAGCNYCNENRTPSPVQDQNAP